MLFCYLGLFVAMISEGHVYVVNEGDRMTLECNFHADQYNLFEYPVLWRKTQYSEESQVNVVGTIIEPFVDSLRFDVTFAATSSRYRLTLTINGNTQPCFLHDLVPILNKWTRIGNKYGL